MSAGNHPSAWQSWRGLIIICAVVVIAQSISTYYLAQHQIDSDDISAVLDARKPRGARGGAEGGGGGGGGTGRRGGGGGREGRQASTTPSGAATWEQPQQATTTTGGVEKVMDELDGSERWSLESSDAVQRWDNLMQKRVERVAEQKGIDPATVMPSMDLRERALATDDLRSEEAQELIAEYSRILRELGQSQE
jgi:hypothetical protein